MTIAHQVLLTELNYTIWANQIVLEACSALSPEELSRPLGASHLSIIRTLRHIYDGERFWVHNLITGSIPDVADIEAPESRINDVPIRSSNPCGSPGPPSGPRPASGS